MKRKLSIQDIQIILLGDYLCYLDNDQDLYNKSRQLAEGARDVDELSAMLRHRYSNLFVEKGEKDKDIKEVNWKEIAQEMFDEAKENKAYEQINES